MRTLVTIALVAVMGITASAQNKNAKHNLAVKGNCGMCKERIEKAAYGVNGVKVADWDEETQNLSIILNEKKNTVEDNSFGKLRKKKGLSFFFSIQRKNSQTR